MLSVAAMVLPRKALRFIATSNHASRWTLDPTRISLRNFLRDPGSAGLERLESLRLIKMNHGIELLGELRAEIVAHALGFRQIDDADGTLQPRRL